MSDDKPQTPASQAGDETQPVRVEGSAPPPAERRGFRERFRVARRTDGQRGYSLGALLASALAGVIVGGLGLATVNALTHDHRDGPGWSERRGPMGRDLGDGDDRRGPMFGGPGGIPGQVQPTTPPEEDDGDSGSSS